jgi:hypothetical protein
VVSCQRSGVAAFRVLFTSPSSAWVERLHPAAVAANLVLAHGNCGQLVALRTDHAMNVCLCEQLRQLFGFCGNVTNCTILGNQRQYALVEYETEQVGGFFGPLIFLGGGLSLVPRDGFAFSGHRAALSVLRLRRCPDRQTCPSATLDPSTREPLPPRKMRALATSRLPSLRSGRPRRRRCLRRERARRPCCRAAVRTGRRSRARRVVAFGLQEAAAALGMSGMTVVDRAIRVETCKSARNATPQAAGDPLAALHAHRQAHLQLIQMQQEQLAAQVAQIRAMSKINPGLATGAARRLWRPGAQPASLSCVSPAGLQGANAIGIVRVDNHSSRNFGTMRGAISTSQVHSSCCHHPCHCQTPSCQASVGTFTGTCNFPEAPFASRCFDKERRRRSNLFAPTICCSSTSARVFARARGPANFPWV